MYTKYFSGLTVQNDKKKSRSQSCAAARFFFLFFPLFLKSASARLACLHIDLPLATLPLRSYGFLGSALTSSLTLGRLDRPPTPGRRAQTARRRLDSSSGFRTLRSIMGSPPGNRGVISAATAEYAKKKKKKRSFNIPHAKKNLVSW